MFVRFGCICIDGVCLLTFVRVGLNCRFSFLPYCTLMINPCLRFIYAGRFSVCLLLPPQARAALRMLQVRETSWAICSIAGNENSLYFLLLINQSHFTVYVLPVTPLVELTSTTSWSSRSTWMTWSRAFSCQRCTTDRYIIPRLACYYLLYVTGVVSLFVVVVLFPMWLFTCTFAMDWLSVTVAFFSIFASSLLAGAHDEGKLQD
jgi:hypothetical protein